MLKFQKTHIFKYCTLFWSSMPRLFQRFVFYKKPLLLTSTVCFDWPADPEHCDWPNTTSSHWKFNTTYHNHELQLQKKVKTVNNVLSFTISSSWEGNRVVRWSLYVFLYKPRLRRLLTAQYTHSKHSTLCCDVNHYLHSLASYDPLRSRSRALSSLYLSLCSLLYLSLSISLSLYTHTPTHTHAFFFLEIPFVHIQPCPLLGSRNCQIWTFGLCCSVVNKS